MGVSIIKVAWFSGEKNLEVLTIVSLNEVLQTVELADKAYIRRTDNVSFTVIKVVANFRIIVVQDKTKTDEVKVILIIIKDVF